MKMPCIFTLYVAFLFFILSPNILLKLPPKAGKYTTAAVHSLVFALILHFTGKMMILNFSRKLEGLSSYTTYCSPIKGEKLVPLSETTIFSQPHIDYANSYCISKRTGLGGYWDNGSKQCLVDGNKYSKIWTYNTAKQNNYSSNNMPKEEFPCCQNQTCGYIQIGSTNQYKFNP